MMTLAHPLIECIAQERFTDASVQLQNLQRDIPESSLPPEEILALIKTAKQHAKVHRAHLVKSLSSLDARKLFVPKEERLDPTWSLEG